MRPLALLLLLVAGCSNHPPDNRRPAFLDCIEMNVDHHYLWESGKMEYWIDGQKYYASGFCAASPVRLR